MNLQALVTRSRYLTLALPLFALASTIHSGCSSGRSGLYYGTYGGGGGSRTPSTTARPDDASPCTYDAPCEDEDGYGYDGYGGYGP